VRDKNTTWGGRLGTGESWWRGGTVGWDASVTGEADERGILLAVGANEDWKIEPKGGYP